MGNIIKVNLSNACGITQTESVTQWDFGYIMQISGLSVQNDTEIHFANHGDKDAIVDVAKYEDGILTVKIPDILLTKGIDIFVHVYIATDEEGKTIRTARIPVKRRAKPSDYIYTEQEHLSYKTLQQNKATRITTTAAGKAIQLTDASNDNLVNLIAHGDSWQNQYEGKNVYSGGDITISKYTERLIEPIKAGTYTISAKIESTYPNADYYGILCLRENDSGFYTIVVSGVLDNGRRYATFTLEEDCYELGFYVADTQYSLEGYTTTYSDIQIEQGSVATSFEPYVGNAPSPSPQYQQPIESLANVEVKVLGGNLFDIQKALDVERYEGYLDKTYFKFMNGKEYTLSFVSNVQDESQWVCASTGNCFNGALQESILYPSVKGKISKTFTIPNDGQEYYLCISVSGAPNYNQYLHWWNETSEDFQINLGEEIPYEPYKEPQTLTIPYVLRGIPIGTTIPNTIKNSPIHMSGVYYDGEQYRIADTKNEEGKDVQRIAKIVFNGEEVFGLNAQASSYGVNAYQYYSHASSYISDCSLCTHLKNAEWVGCAEEGNNKIYIASDRVFVFRTDGIQTVEEFKESLKALYNGGTPLTVYLVLSEPIVTNLTEAEIESYKQLHTNYPCTTIMSDAEVEVEYVADTKNYIDNKFKELEIALANTNARLL